ncbi:MAG: hypothetical protein WAL85_06800 [Candidatus Korobacteraceae bacterium]
MKARILALVIGAMLVAVSATAQTVYDNGPTDGNTYAWTINFGYAVSDTFNVGADNTTVTGANFAMWLFPGDTLETAELSITSSENGGTSFFDQTVNFIQSNCVLNQSQYGSYNVCLESSSFSGPILNSGTYWLTLQNATVNTGDPVYWDQNSGPSSASENTIGTIPSESFTVLGVSTSTTNSTTFDSVPEPDSITLLGSGAIAIFGFVGALRRELF